MTTIGVCEVANNRLKVIDGGKPTAPKHELPKLDHYERGYNIRRLDNRVRVTISAHMGMSATREGPYEAAHLAARGCNFYVGLRVMVRAPECVQGEPLPDSWQYVPGSTIVGRTDSHAIDLAVQMYNDAEKRLARLLPGWFAEHFPKLAEKML